MTALALGHMVREAGLRGSVGPSVGRTSSTASDDGGFLSTWLRETALRFLGGKTFFDSSLSILLSSPSWGVLVLAMWGTW